MINSDKSRSSLQHAEPSPDPSVTTSILPLIYDELRVLASRYMSLERVNHTLQPTALVHEVYIRLADSKHIEWRGKAEFFSLAAQTIRRILVEHARKNGAAKRGGGSPRVPFVEEFYVMPTKNVDLVALDESLTSLLARSPRQAQIVELRFFAGMTIEQSAKILGVSPGTVKGEWHAARAWLAAQLCEQFE